MTKEYVVTPVKWFAAVLFMEQSTLAAVLSRLADCYAAVDFRSPAFPFVFSDYYRSEMGTGLQRVLVGFSGTVAPDRLIEIKLRAAELENEFSVAGKRRVNIDPGYLDLFKVVLASFKGRGNKVYLGQGVWADPTLYYRHRAFHSFPWSFPDFKSGLYDAQLKRLRELYKQDLKTRDKAV